MFDLDLQHPLEIFGRHGTHELVDNVAVAPDDERFRHAVNTPLDCSAAVAVGADNMKRIAMTA